MLQDIFGHIKAIENAKLSISKDGTEDCNVAMADCCAVSAFDSEEENVDYYFDDVQAITFSDNDEL